MIVLSAVATTISYNQIKLINPAVTSHELTAPSTAISLIMCAGSIGTIGSNQISAVHVGIATQSDNMRLRETGNNIQLLCTNWATPCYWMGISSTAEGTIGISDNLIQGPATLPAYTADSNVSGKLMGIYIRAQTGPYIISCNGIQNTHWCIAQAGAVGPALTIENNRFFGSKTGVTLFANGYIGPQGSGVDSTTNDNEWDTGSMSFKMGVYNANGNFDRFYLRGISNSIYNPALSEQAVFNQFPVTLIASPSNSIDTTICSLLTPTFPHRSFADIQPYLESIALDTLQFASDSASNMKWSQESLIGLIQKWPDLLDSSAVISAYYDSASSLSYAKLMQVFTKMQSYTDTRNKNEYKALNSGTTPIDDNETNLQVINGLYLKYFMGTMDSIFPSGNLMDSTDLNSVYNVASQCYLSGGPAVYLARSMYAVAIMDDSTQFSDDCTIYAARMSYASNSNEVKTALVDSIYTFKIYPNPMDRENGVNVQSSEVGEITFYNLLGQITYKARLSKGITIFDCVQLSCENNIILYRAKLQSGKTETGKIIVLK